MGVIVCHANMNQLVIEYEKFHEPVLEKQHRQG